MLIAVTVACWWLAGRLSQSGKDARWLLCLAAFNLVSLVPELALRTLDFRSEPGDQCRNLHPAFHSCFVPDKDLFWKREPSSPGVNSLGFCGGEINRPKPPGVFRILFLGDSCAEQDYARLVEKCLNGPIASDVTRFECIPLAVAGYSSHQGRVLAELYSAAMEPDLAVVCFGWNDHWQAYHTTDAEAAIGPVEQLIRDAYQYSRLLQLGSRIVGVVQDFDPGGFLDQVRVPPDQYRENIRLIKRSFDTQGVPTIYVSAPTSHYELGVPDYLVEEGLAPDKESVIRRHRTYNRIIREVAEASGARVLDLEVELSHGDSLERVFLADGIHFTDEGLRMVALRMCRFFEREIPVPPIPGWTSTGRQAADRSDVNAGMTHGLTVSSGHKGR